MKKLFIRLAVALAIILVGSGALLYRPELSPAELEARYADDASRFLDLGERRIHYKDEGSGPALLLIHGTGSSLHTWDGWVAELREDFRIVRLDLPGFGLTGPEPDHDYSPERRVEAMVALLDHLGVQRCSVAGNSLGGYLAWQLTVRHPDRVDAQVLIDAAGYPQQRPGMTVMDLGRVPILRGVLSRLTPRFLIAAAVRESYGDPSLVAPALIDRYYELLRRQGNRRAMLTGLNAERPPGHDKIRTINQPTLVMWGTEDRLISVELAERFHGDLPSSELLVYPDIGHVPMEEIPERSARDARAFLLRALGPEEPVDDQSKKPL